MAVYQGRYAKAMDAFEKDCAFIGLVLLRKLGGDALVATVDEGRNQHQVG